MRIKKNDVVKMLAGKDSGKTGKVLRVLPDEKKIVVEGLNMFKKHNKPKKEGEKGQRVEMPRKIDISNAIVVCPKCSASTRVSFKIEGDKKVRTCKKCQAEI